MSPQLNKAYAGGFHMVDQAFDVFSSNITPDRKTGIGAWSDEQIITAIREGKTPNGNIIFPPMPVPTYHGMSDYDAKAIVTYLRTLKPVRQVIPAPHYNLPQSAMPPVHDVKAPPPQDKVAYGRYVVTALAHCFECHTGPDDHGAPDVQHKLGAGGFMIMLAPNAAVATPNITQDTETGIGAWSDADIKKAITDGIRPDGRHLAPPMPYSYFKKMTAEDLDAVVAFLRTVPAISNKVQRTDFQVNTFK